MSSLRRLSRGSSGLLWRASSLRMSPRSQPPCTNVSLPSGRTSVTVTWRSVRGLVDFTQARTKPWPSTVVSSASGLDRNDAPVPFGGCCPRYGGVAVHRPFSPEPVFPVKFVIGRAFGSHVNALASERFGGFERSESRLEKYHERALVPSTG